MAGNKRIKGITIEIDGTVTGLDKALKEVDSQLSKTQSALRDTNRLLKLDPGNADLLKQKQQYLQTAIEETNKKLEAEKEALKQLKENDTSEDVSEKQNALEREIIETQAALSNLEKQYKSMGDTAGTALKKAGAKVQEVGKKMTAAGKGLTTYVTGPIVAVGAAAMAAFNEVDEGADIIVTKTGATGEALEDMEQRMKNLATSIPTDFATAGAAIGEVNTRFKITGDEMEQLSGQFIKFAKMNKTDVSSSIDNVQKVMAAYGLKTEDVGLLLDTLNATGQKTGISVDTLSKSMISNGKVLREMGFSAADSAAFLGELEVSGADSSAVMAGLKKALTNAAAEGKPMNEALSSIQESIKGATSDEEAMQLAMELFGTKSGPIMAEALQKGTISLDSFGSSLTENAGSVSETFEGIQDPADKLTVVMNTLKEIGADVGEVLGEVLQPVLEKVREKVQQLKEWWQSLSPETKQTIVRIALIVAAIGPLLLAIGEIITKIGSVISFIGTVKTAISGAGGLIGLIGSGGPLLLAIGAVVAIAALVITHWDEVKTFVLDTLWPNIRDAFNWIKNKVSTVFTAIQGFWTDTLLPVLTEIKEFIVNTLWPRFKTYFELISGKVKTVFAGIAEFWTNTLSPAFTAIKEFIVNTLWPRFKTYFELISGKVKAVFEGIAGFWTNTLSPAFTAIKEFIVNTLWPRFKTYFELISSKVSTVFGAISGFWENILKPVFTAIKNFIVNTLWPNLRDKFGWMKQKVEDVFNGINWVWENVLKKAFEAIGNTWDTICQGIQTVKETYLDPVFTWLEQTFSPIFTTLADFWNNTLGPAFETLGSVFNDAKNGVFSTVANWISGTFSAAFSGLHTVINGVIGAVKSVMSWFQRGIEAISNFREQYNATAEATRETLTMPQYDEHGRPMATMPMATGGFLREGHAIIAEAGPELLSVQNGRAIVEPLSTGSGSDVAARLELLTDVVSQYLPGIAGRMDRPISIDGRSFGGYVTRTVDRNITQRQASQRIARGG